MMKPLGYFSKPYILMKKGITNIYGQGTNDCRKITTDFKTSNLTQDSASQIKDNQNFKLPEQIQNSFP